MMKYNKWLFGAVACALFVSCADDELAEYKTATPESIAQYAYLDAYAPLKTYVDRAANPGFKLGTGVDVKEYNKQEGVYCLVNANFDEMTAGNAMKYSSVVKDDGTMDFSTVSKFIEIASGAGQSIYGHTLCWHSQQNKTYLEGLIVPREVKGEGNPALYIKNTTVGFNVWDAQAIYTLPTTLTKGVEYTITMRAKASEATSINCWPQGEQVGNDTPTMYSVSAISASESYTNYMATFIPDIDVTKITFCFGTFAGDIYFDDVTLKAAGSDENLIDNSSFDDEDDMTNWSKPGWHEHVSLSITEVTETPTTGEWIELVTNGDCEGTEVANLFSPTTAPSTIVDGEGVDGSRAVKVVTPADPAQTWDAQLFISSDHVFAAGDSYKVSFKVKASQNATIETQAHAGPGEYIFYSMLGNIDVTTDWKTITKEGVITADQATNSDKSLLMRTIAFNLAVTSTETMFWFDDVSFSYYKKATGNLVDLTPEEKADTLTWAMDQWISGMMDACNGYVTAWDVVNEPLAGKDTDGDGWYDLQSVIKGNVSEKDAASCFYWQDYLGDNYVRTAVKLARQYGPENMKLFINDYNLESNWDDNKKLKSLIHWIETWESDNETVIDGIGTQMHVSYSENADRQKSQEEHVVKMFELLAATGKLVKISELDMSLLDAAGEVVLTKDKDFTFERKQKMADYYQFIVDKYFEIIPAAQRYGITHWSPTDSPAESGWRGGEAIGLWTLDYMRKPAYAGFAEGLK